MKVRALKASEYNRYYKTYIDKVNKETNLIDGFINGQDYVLHFFKDIPEDKLDYRYAEDKWSIKEVFQHIIDTERVFMYRCFRIARHDKTPLAGFEQDDYVKPSNADKKSLQALLEEYQSVRQSFIVLLKSLLNTDLKYIGHASGNPLSARAAAFIVLGHETHHIEVVKKHYL
jgi:uncharacterized damage-inducible protein DinB